jgi:hypothetical protein
VSDKKLLLDTIHIIESIAEDQLHTGRKLRDDIEPLALGIRSHFISVKLHQVKTAQEFFECLRTILDHCREGHLPLLHIETHGNDDGIELASGEFLTWGDLKDPLTAINVASNLNLLVILAACEGANLLHVINPNDRAAVRFIIGPKRKAKAVEMERATVAFYKTLFGRGDGIAAWKAMNAEIGTGETFSIFAADVMFIYVFRQYLKTLCTPEELKNRENRRVLDAVVKGVQDLKQFRKFFGEYIREYERDFARLKERFFLCDLYPENMERFDLSFQDCVVGIQLTK